MEKRSKEEEQQKRLAKERKEKEERLKRLAKERSKEEERLKRFAQELKRKEERFAFLVQENKRKMKEQNTRLEKERERKRIEIVRRTFPQSTVEEWKPSGSGIYLKGSTHILTCTASLLP